jgi:hypothetical protein
MADSLLDFDYNSIINKALGTTNQPFSGLINDPNYNSSLNVDTLLGAGLGYANSLYKGKTDWEKGLAAATGAKSARTKAINSYVENILTQQQYSKNVLDMTLNKGKIARQPLELLKLQGELEEQPYDLIKKRFEAEAAPYKTGQEKNKFHESSLFMQGVKDEIKMLENKGDFAGVNFIKANPKEYFKKLSERDYRTNPMPDGYNSAALSIGLDPNNRANWSQQDWIDLDTLVKAPDSQTAQNTNLATQQANQTNPRGIPLQKVLSRDDHRAQILARRNREKTMSKDYTNTGGVTTSNGIVNVSEEQNAKEFANDTVFDSKNLEYYVPSQKELRQGVIKKGTNKKFPEGAVFTPTGINYTEDEWNNMGSAFKFALRPTRKPEQANDLEIKTLENAEAAGNQKSYLFTQLDRRQKVVKEILSKPQFLKDLASVGGRLITNLDLGSYGFTSDVQDIKNLFDLVKNQSFVAEIQDMRANNETGGAVGNVSDREVAMFQSIAAALQNSGSAEFMYTQLSNLYNNSTDVLRRNKRVYTDLYGDSYAEKFGLNEFNVDDYGKVPNYQDALKQVGFEAFSDRKNQRLLEGAAAKNKEEIDRILERKIKKY